MIGSLIDPCGTLGSVRKKLTAEVCVMVIFIFSMIGLSFVTPGRYASPVMIVLYQPVLFSNSLGMQSLRLIAKPGKSWFFWPIRISLVVIAGLLLLTWLDVSINKFPSHYVDRNLPLAQIPAFREANGLFVLLGFCSLSMLLTFARRASESLASAEPGVA